MGLTLTAIWAGINPIKVPRTIIIDKAPKIYSSGTVGFEYGKSVKSWVAILIANKINVPNIIPIIPARTVKKTDSINICVLTWAGLAPRALLIPISFVLSFTEISNILPIPITPARIVAIPTTKERNVSPVSYTHLTLPTILLV